MIGALKQLEAGRKAEDVAREVGVSTEENLRQLGCYVEQHGRPVSVYTDKASLFQMAPRAIHHRDAPEEQGSSQPSPNRAEQKWALLNKSTLKPEGRKCVRFQMRAAPTSTCFGR